MAWMLLWRATIAARRLEKAKKKDKSFYEGIIKSLQFYVETQLPITLGGFNALMSTSSAAVDIDETMFPN